MLACRSLPQYPACVPADAPLIGVHGLALQLAHARAHRAECPISPVALQTWGSLNPERSNAVLLHTGLSASSHAASHPLNTNAGWWERFVGPGKALDTRKVWPRVRTPSCAYAADRLQPCEPRLP